MTVVWVEGASLWNGRKTTAAVGERREEAQSKEEEMEFYKTTPRGSLATVLWGAHWTLPCGLYGPGC